jgi:phage gpG-like protein
LKILPLTRLTRSLGFITIQLLKKVKYFNGTVWLTVVDDLDTRLTNSRTPTSHVIATNLALGAEHTISGAAAGMVLRASEHLQLTSNNYYTRILEQLE